MAHANKMHWWVRLYCKIFGKHPNVYAKEEIRSMPCDYIDDGIDPDLWT